ncbi:MAG: L,D-transpeptidase [Akkermansia sp.]|nr:L,D-transpeptidase [Akkermansia sp.]
MPHTIHVCVSEQRLTYGDFSALVSTGAAGVGTEAGSGRTPLGRFRICSKHGENAPLNTVFRARIPVGIYPAAARGDDAILSRILCLDGLEPANANTRSRYIYIHGTNEVEKLGTPASHGCIRLSPQDVATLFELVPLGTEMLIEA